MHFRIDVAPAIQTIRAYADDAVRSMRDTYGLCLDHSLESLAHLDDVLATWHEDGATADTMTPSIFAFGSYAGEVLCEHEPGRWIEPPTNDHGAWDDLFPFVRLLDGREWRPIGLAFAALMDGPPYSLLQSARRLLATGA
ncbi:hypothetical protein [Dyella japonica]|uniref:Uncharacterized protein n=1 Tax=Dyella japonica A8 TaxID=1217721 RepID=A0A075JYE2_9GAMM|nr:hypothetical protein [Dyella japonica]AIF46477.1 hypothetical protein HY57_03970 [Dyella japonica A8]